MANALYSLGKAALLNGDVAYDSDNIKVVLCTSGYVVNLTTDDFLADITAGNRVATSNNLSSKTTTLGTFDAADITFAAVSGSQVTQFVVYQDTGNEATSRLLCYFNVATNLPVTPNGGDITISWSASGIFSL